MLAVRVWCTHTCLWYRRLDVARERQECVRVSVCLCVCGARIPVFGDVPRRLDGPRETPRVRMCVCLCACVVNAHLCL